MAPLLIIQSSDIISLNFYVKGDLKAIRQQALIPPRGNINVSHYYVKYNGESVDSFESQRLCSPLELKHSQSYMGAAPVVKLTRAGLVLGLEAPYWHTFAFILDMFILVANILDLRDLVNFCLLCNHNRISENPVHETAGDVKDVLKKMQ
ncbi:hypothetical protein Q7C36_003193 [Tachysurus vachellii]|uniref:Uncharacterized protein n=1 Tax=Tachysurus vachellii TaxID=175792 RepID=A0AA88NV23_TACVA|nr:hypothetical protein Q7C36_003193 [Tachysurus vachellii]